MNTRWILAGAALCALTTGCEDTREAPGGAVAANNAANNAAAAPDLDDLTDASGDAAKGDADGLDDAHTAPDAPPEDAASPTPDAIVEDAAAEDTSGDAAGPADLTPDTAADLTEDTAADTGNGEPCVALREVAQGAALPVDIVWIIDASPSMDQEIANIEANLNRFAARIAASALDYRVVIIGSDADGCADGRCYLEICVPPPLSGAPGCPDQDSERYLHVRRGVHSRDGLDVAIQSWPTWSTFLRPRALTHFVMVTDDNVGWGADDDDFLAFTRQHSDRLGQVRFHSVVDLIGYQPGCGIFDEPCSCGEERGQAYINLSEQTGGLVQSVCQEDWAPIFDALEVEVREGAALPCTYALPDPPPGQRRDPDQVNVVLSTDGAPPAPLPQVARVEDCALVDGWYYDDPDDPSLLILCPGACDPDASAVDVEIGCDTIKF